MNWHFLVFHVFLLWQTGYLKGYCLTPAYLWFLQTSSYWLLFSNTHWMILVPLHWLRSVYRLNVVYSRECLTYTWEECNQSSRLMMLPSLLLIFYLVLPLIQSRVWKSPTLLLSCLFLTPVSSVSSYTLGLCC